MMVPVTNLIKNKKKPVKINFKDFKTFERVYFRIAGNNVLFDWITCTLKNVC